MTIMANVVAGKFANAEMVSRIRSDVLLEWLLPRRGYFEGRGVRLVPQVDCAKLAEVLRDPTPDMPVELLEGLYAFRGLDKEAGMDAIAKEAKRRGVDLGLGPEATPLDVVMRAWSRDRQLVELVYARHAVRRGRSFQYFSTDADPLPEFAGPTAEQLRLLEEGLAPFYLATSRGPGVRVRGSVPRRPVRRRMTRLAGRARRAARPTARKTRDRLSRGSPRPCSRSMAR